MPISNALIQATPRNKLMDAQMLRPTGEGSYLRQQFPQVYGFLGGLAGTAPDEMAGSVLDPNTAAVRQAAAYSYLPGLVASSAPLGKAGAGLGMLAGMTRGAQKFDNSALMAKKFDVVKRDASEIFGAGAERLRYTDPASGGMIDVLKRPDNTASVLGLEVPEAFRGKGIGESLQSQVLQDFPAMMGQVSSKAAAKTAFRLGRRPPNQPDATLDDVFKLIDENSSVNLVSPKMQQTFNSAPTSTFDNTALTGAKFVAPQDEALRLAQQRAALPLSQGGLGLPKNNTPEQRAAAMGGKEMTHFSRTGGDYTTLDSGKFAIAPFDAVGTHVGSKEAAMERFQNTVGYKVNNLNYANDELRGVTYPVTILGDRPLMNQNGMPWGEDDLNAFLRKEGGHNWSDIKGGAMTYQDMNLNLRKKLFEKQGYTSIPYYNEVEGKGSISYITPPENIRSRFAAFDPFRKTAAIAATMGVAAPDLLAGQSPQQAPKFDNSALMK